MKNKCLNWIELNILSMKVCLGNIYSFNVHTVWTIINHFNIKNISNPPPQFQYFKWCQHHHSAAPLEPRCMPKLSVPSERASWRRLLAKRLIGVHSAWIPVIVGSPSDFQGFQREEMKDRVSLFWSLCRPISVRLSSIGLGRPTVQWVRNVIQSGINLYQLLSIVTGARSTQRTFFLSNHRLKKTWNVSWS